MADTLDSTGKYVPKDLQISAQPDSVDKNKFRVSATGLKIDTNYVFQFQYVFPDGEVSEWSPGYTLNTSGESAPGVPTGTIVPTFGVNNSNGILYEDITFGPPVSVVLLKYSLGEVVALFLQYSNLLTIFSLVSMFIV